MFDFTIESAFDADYFGSNGLTVNKLTSSVLPGDPFPADGGANYLYIAGSDTLRIGGAVPAIIRGNDFDIEINNLLMSPVPDQWLASVSTTFGFDGSSVFDEFSITQVPAPTTAWLFCTALAGLIGVRKHKNNS